MRTTQYIGLTDAAAQWVKNATRSESVQITTGMFDEPVMGKKYWMPVPKGPNIEYTAEEVVQASPWSSGPMIMTHLKLTLVKESGQVLDMGFAYSWAFAPGMVAEVDAGSGHYCV